MVQKIFFEKSRLAIIVLYEGERIANLNNSTNDYENKMGYFSKSNVSQAVVFHTVEKMLALIT